MSLLTNGVLRPSGAGRRLGDIRKLFFNGGNLSLYSKNVQISRTIAGRYGTQNVKAWHTNYAAFVYNPGPWLDNTNLVHLSVVEPPSFWKFPRLWLQHLLTPYSEHEREHLQRTMSWLKGGRGYSSVQGTQPQTLGYSLADSPAGLLAWLYEKLVVWSDDYPWDDDESMLLRSWALMSVED